MHADPTSGTFWESSSNNLMSLRIFSKEYVLVISFVCRFFALQKYIILSVPAMFAAGFLFFFVANGHFLCVNSLKKASISRKHFPVEAKKV